MCNSHTQAILAKYHGRLDLLGPMRSPTKAALGSNTCQLFSPLATSTFHEAHILSHEHCPQSCLWHTKILSGYFFNGWLRLKMDHIWCYECMHAILILFSTIYMLVPLEGNLSIATVCCDSWWENEYTNHFGCQPYDFGGQCLKTATTNLQLTTKMICLCMISPRVTTDGCNGQDFFECQHTNSRKRQYP